MSLIKILRICATCGKKDSTSFGFVCKECWGSPDLLKMRWYGSAYERSVNEVKEKELKK